MRLAFLALVAMLGLLPFRAEAGCNDALLENLRPHVFRLVVGFPDGRRVQQTAFRVKGHDGLFTALHGVVGADSIEADRADPGGPTLETYSRSRNNALHVVRHHWQADLAFLRPVDSVFPAAGSGIGKGGGLVVDASQSYGEAGAKIGRHGCTIGYPKGVGERQDHDVTFRSEIVGLHALIGAIAENAAIRGYLDAVESPHVGRKVLPIQSTMRKGDSGAPIVDSESGHLVGFVDGGIGDGSLGLNWAIPLATTCFFADRADCTLGAPGSGQVGKVDAAIKRFSEGRASMYATAELRLPLEIGTTVAGPRAQPHLGPFREIEAKATITACNAVDLSIDMINRDKVYGFCIRPVLEVYGDAPGVPIAPENAATTGNPASPGRLCVGSVLEDEAILRLHELVTDPETAPALRSLLSIDAKTMAKIGESRKSLCAAREPGIPCEPYRVEEGGTWQPSYITRRGVQTLSVKLPKGQACEPDGASRIHELRWLYIPSRKPDGIFEALDRVEDLLRSAGRLSALGGIGDLLQGTLEKCAQERDPAACALFSLVEEAMFP